jgi:hypothetical protein
MEYPFYDEKRFTFHVHGTLRDIVAYIILALQKVAVLLNRTGLSGQI